mgnify:CR=1 FL=1
MSIIYILKRDDRPELLKVGKSLNSAFSRAKSYTDGQWKVVTEFDVPPSILNAIEKKAHEILKNNGHWLAPNVTDGSAREIFVCDISSAEEAVKEAIYSVANLEKSRLGSLAIAYSKNYNFLRIDNNISEILLISYMFLIFILRFLSANNIYEDVQSSAYYVHNFLFITFFIPTFFAFFQKITSVKFILFAIINSLFVAFFLLTPILISIAAAALLIISIRMHRNKKRSE